MQDQDTFWSKRRAGMHDPQGRAGRLAELDQDIARAEDMDRQHRRTGRWS